MTGEMVSAQSFHLFAIVRLDGGSYSAELASAKATSELLGLANKVRKR